MEPVAFTGIAVTILIFVMGLAYQTGKQANRIDNIEAKWIELKSEFKDFKTDMKTDMNSLHNHMNHMERIIVSGEKEGVET